MALAILNYLLALTAIAFSLSLGGRPERQGGLIIAIMLLLTIIGQGLFAKHFHTVDPVSLAQDLFAFISFSLIGIYSKRIWPLWAAAFQLLSVGAHFVRALEIPVRPIVYAWMKSGPTWAVLVLLIGGTIISRRRRSLPANASSFGN